MRIAKLKTYLRAERGVAAIEFAFIMPFLLLLFFGLVDITDAVSNNRRITSLANSVGDLVAQNRDKVLKTDIDDYFKIAKIMMKPASDSNVKIRLYGYRKVGTSAVQQWLVDNGKGVACNKTPDATTIYNLMTVGNDVIVAQACMQYTPVVTGVLVDAKNVFNFRVFKLEQMIMMRPRASAKLDCFATASSTAAGC
jgi:Flp pilus assembly protein TadG